MKLRTIPDRRGANGAKIFGGFVFQARVTQCLALAVTAVLNLAGPSFASELSPSLTGIHHIHRAWRNLDGSGFGAITAIAQTADGYIWLATPTGLLRFDGVRTVPVLHATDMSFNESVRVLRGTSDGTLWIGTNRGLFGFRNGSFLPNPSLSNIEINAISEDSDGTIWIGGKSNGTGRLCALRNQGDECHGQDGLLGPEIVGLHRDRAGALWVLGIDRVWKWGGDQVVSFALPTSADVLRNMTEMADGAIVIGLRGKLARIANGKLEALTIPNWTKELALDKTLVDGEGSLWVGTADSGLLRLDGARLSTYSAPDGLSSDTILDLFEDREGNVWVSTSRGLDQFRPIAASLESVREGLRGRPRAVLKALDGSLWVSTTFGIHQKDSSGIWKRRRSWKAGVSSLFEDRLGRIWAPSHSGVQYFDGDRFVDALGIPAGTVDAMVESSNGDLWLAHREFGILRVQSDDKAQFTVKAMLKPSGIVRTLTIDPVDKSLWVGLMSGVLENVRDGKFTGGTLLLEGPNSSLPINHIRAELDGTLWVSSLAGLHRISNGRVTRLNVQNGLPCDTLLSSFTDETSLWLNARCGVIRVDKAAIGAWADAADKGLPHTIESQLLDVWDGVDQGIVGRTFSPVATTYNHSPTFALSTEGWPVMIVSDRVATINPQRLRTNVRPPSVYIEKLVADGQGYEAQKVLSLPPLQRNLEIDYTGLNFASPERIQFRYKLEGRDANWQDAGHRRQAFYTDLAPGQYRFRVSAANERGAWNLNDDSIEFSIEPAWWQTLTFRISCAAAILLMIYAFYRLRIAELSQLLASETAASQENARLYRDLQEREERVRRLFNSNIIGIFTWNLDGQILDANEAFCRIVGYDSNDLLSGMLRWKDLLPHEWDPNDQIMMDMLATGVALPFEADYIKKDGSRVPVLIGAAMFDRTPTEGVAFVLDLTDRKRAEQENATLFSDLQRSEAFLAEGQKLSDTGSWSRNIKSGELIWSAQNYRIFDLDPEHGSPPNYDEFVRMIHPEDLAEWRRVAEPAVATGSWFAHEFRIISAQGAVKYIHTRGQPIFDQEGVVYEYIGTTMNISERKRTEDDLRAAQLELSHATRLTTMGELAASIAHEVSQPLTATVTNAETCLLLLSKTVPDIPATRAAVERIIRDGRQAGDVLKSIRSMLHKSTPDFYHLTINELVSAVLDLVKGEIRQNAVTLETKLELELPLIYGDRVQLQQVIVNLVKNAIESMVEGRDGTKVLRICTSSSDSEVKITVEDNGPGLKNANRLFEPFFTTKAQGMGIGLSICRSIVEAHGGVLSAMSLQPKGACFHFTLPVAKR